MKTRRVALKSIAAMATTQTIPSRVLGLNSHTAPSETLTMGIIGFGCISSSHLTKSSKLFALTNVDSKHLAQGMKDAKGVKNGVIRHSNFRELLACEDIWCEKLVSCTIDEGLEMIKAVEKDDRIFHLNTWIRFEADFYGLNAPLQLMNKAVMNDMFGWHLLPTRARAMTDRYLKRLTST